MGWREKLKERVVAKRERTKERGKEGGEERGKREIYAVERKTERDICKVKKRGINKEVKRRGEEREKREKVNNVFEGEEEKRIKTRRKRTMDERVIFERKGELDKELEIKRLKESERKRKGWMRFWMRRRGW